MRSLDPKSLGDLTNHSLLFFIERYTAQQHIIEDLRDFTVELEIATPSIRPQKNPISIHWQSLGRISPFKHFRGTHFV
jgi:hypothetical protein